MRPILKWTLGIMSLAGVLLLASWGIVQGRAEQAKEREREAPIAVPPRLEALPEGGAVVKLEPEARSALDLATAELKEGPVQAGLKVSGVILDPLPYLDLQGKLQAAKAEAQAARSGVDTAQAAWERMRTLNQEGKGASDKATQEAQSRLRAEEAKAATAKAGAERLEAAWRQQGLPAELDAFLAFRQALVRLELPLGQPLPPHLKLLSARLASDEAPLRLRVLGLASGAAPSTGGLAILSVLDAPGLRPGQALEAFLPTGDKAKGLVPPGSALLRAEGRVWVYVARPDGRFERRALRLLNPVGDSYAVEGVAPGEQVVVRGAQALLAEEYRSQIHVGEAGAGAEGHQRKAGPEGGAHEGRREESR